MVELTDEVDKFTELLDYAAKEIEYSEYSNGITVYQYLQAQNNSGYCRGSFFNQNNISQSRKLFVHTFNWAKIARKASYYYKLLNDTTLPKVRGVNLYKGNDVAYIIAAIRLVQD
jgi:hypothetical protein